MARIGKRQICAILGAKVAAVQGHRGIHDRCTDYSKDEQTMKHTIIDLVEQGYMEITLPHFKPPFYDPTEEGLAALRKRSRRENVRNVAQSIIKYNNNEIQKDRKIILFHT